MDSSFIERRQAIYTLMYIADHPDCTRMDLMFGDGLEGMSSARFLRMKDLLDRKLVRIDKIDCDGCDRIRLNLTAEGKQLADALRVVLAMPDPVYDEI